MYHKINCLRSDFELPFFFVFDYIMTRVRFVLTRKNNNNFGIVTIT